MCRIWSLAVCLSVIVACEHPSSSPPPPPAAVHAVAPTRGAMGDADLREMLAELASSKACGMIRGGFYGLRAPDHPDVVTGVLWIRECEISNVGVQVTFHITGNGWVWVDQSRSKGGGTFAVRQYVRFSIATTSRGAIDIFYDRGPHVATLWFTPDRPPTVEFKTIGDIDVDSQGVWSSVIGGVGTLLASSPGEEAQSQATTQGTQELTAKLAHGLAVTIDLCTGLQRIHLAKPPKGEMGVADVGETWRVPAEIQPNGVMIIGPQDATDGMTLKAEASKGAVKLALVCAKQADAVAREFMAGRLTPNANVLATTDVRGRARLEIKPTVCPVVVVATALDDAPARFAWERPSSEIARATGGPLVPCRKR